MKVRRVGNGGGGPPEDNPDGEDISSEHESYPSAVYKPSPSPSPAPPIVEEASTTTSRIELPVSTLNEESLIRLQLFPPLEEFSIHTPAMSNIDPAFNAEKMLLAKQELLREEADAERIRFMQQELLLERKMEDLLQEKNIVGANQERLRVVASKVQKQSEFNALGVAMAGQRIKEEESKADAEYRAAENKIRNAGLHLQEEAEIANRRIRTEETTQRLRASEIERQRELNIKEINEQRLRDESNARNMQQRLVELEHQSRATTEDLVNLSELKQRELTLRDECIQGPSSDPIQRRRGTCSRSSRVYGN